MSFDSKFKDSPWRSRTSGNLSYNGKVLLLDFIIKTIRDSQKNTRLHIS